MEIVKETPEIVHVRVGPTRIRAYTRKQWDELVRANAARFDKAPATNDRRLTDEERRKAEVQSSPKAVRAVGGIKTMSDFKRAMKIDGARLVEPGDHVDRALKEGRNAHS